MTKYNKLLNIVNDAIIDNEEAIDAFETILTIVRDQGYDEGVRDTEAEFEADAALAKEEEDDEDGDIHDND